MRNPNRAIQTIVLLFYAAIGWLSSPSLKAATERSSSAPYISGDSFRFAADYVYDELDRKLDPNNVKEGSLLFVKTDFLADFFQNIHPQIPSNYILLTHNSDLPIPGKYSAFLEDPKIIAWIGQNVENYSHPKLHPIPIGIANRCWEHGNTDVLDKMKKIASATERKILLYMNFKSATYPEERAPLYRQFKNKKFCTVGKQKKFTNYLNDLSISKFVLCPRGNGLDTHRTWEALLMGAIPIVRSSTLDPLYDELPVLIVREWNEVTPELLKKKWRELSSMKSNSAKLSIDYWLTAIRATIPNSK